MQFSCLKEIIYRIQRLAKNASRRRAASVKITDMQAA
jgi:hypothetical protein